MVFIFRIKIQVQFTIEICHLRKWLDLPYSASTYKVLLFSRGVQLNQSSGGSGGGGKLAQFLFFSLFFCSSPMGSAQFLLGLISAPLFTILDRSCCRVSAVLPRRFNWFYSVRANSLDNCMPIKCVLGWWKSTGQTVRVNKFRFSPSQQTTKIHNH